MDEVKKQEYLRERGLDIVPFAAFPSEEIWQAWRDETAHFWQEEQAYLRNKVDTNQPLTELEQTVLAADFGPPQNGDDALDQIYAAHPEFADEEPLPPFQPTEASGLSFEEERAVIFERMRQAHGAPILDA